MIYSPLKISNRRTTQRCNASAFFYAKYAVYWPEGGATSQYSVFIGQKMSSTGTGARALLYGSLFYGRGE